MTGLGRTLIIIGIVIVAAGVLISFGDRLPFRIGRLPGDLVYRGKNTTVYFPIVTSIVLSIVLTLVLWIFGRSR
jgi:hypothetical protein